MAIERITVYAEDESAGPDPVEIGVGAPDDSWTPDTTMSPVAGIEFVNPSDLTNISLTGEGTSQTGAGVWQWSVMVGGLPGGDGISPTRTRSYIHLRRGT